MSLKHCFLIRDVRPISQKAEWQQLWSKASRHIRKKNPADIKTADWNLVKVEQGQASQSISLWGWSLFLLFFFFFPLWVAEARWARPTLLLWNLTADGLISSLQSLVESCSRWIDLYSMNHLFIFSKSLGLSLTARGGSHSRKCSGLNLSTCRWCSSDPKCFVMQLGRVCGTVGFYQWNYVAGMEKGKSFFSVSTSPSHSLGFTWAANQGKELLSTKNVTF